MKLDETKMQEKWADTRARTTYRTVPYSRNYTLFRVGVYSFDGIGRHHVEKPDQSSSRGRFSPLHTCLLEVCHNLNGSLISVWSSV